MAKADDLMPRRMGLSPKTTLPAAAAIAGATAIAFGRFRHVEWSTDDEVLEAVLTRLKQDWGYTW